MESISRGRISGGRVVLPAGLGKELGIEDGSEVVLSRSTHGIEIRTLVEVVRQVQGRFARLIKSGEGMVEDLIRDRRTAAEQESSRPGCVRPTRLAVPGN